MSRLDAKLGAVGDMLRTAAWHARQRLLVVGATTLVAVGGIAGWVLVDRGSDPIEQEVRGAVVLLRSDLAGNIEELDGSYRSSFRGVRNGDLVGDVVRLVKHGPCWGFDVVFERDWLAAGRGEVRIGEPRRFDDRFCRP